MNTAQVSVELILAGILALCAFVLPFAAGTDFKQALPADNMILIIILGAAYLVGVVSDKLADVLLGSFEKYKRLQHGDDYLKKHPKYKKDPFPQKELEFRLKKAKDGRLDWMDSLRSRIRTSRELAVYGLPATAGFVIYLQIMQVCSNTTTCSSHDQYWFIGINILIIVITVFVELRGRNIPATGDLIQDSKLRDRQMKLARKQMLVQSWTYYLLLANSTIAILVNMQNNIDAAVIGFGGMVITLLGLWTWNAITETYMKFIAREMPHHIADKAED